MRSERKLKTIVRYEDVAHLSEDGFRYKRRSDTLLREEYARSSSLAIPNLIAPVLLRKITRNIRSLTFDDMNYELGSEFQNTRSRIAKRLHALLNNPRLFSFVESVTGCGPILHLNGRITWMAPERKHRYLWHSDLVVPSRLVGVSLNLNRYPCEGGVFQIRNVRKKHTIHELADPRMGDVHIFAIRPDLEHRVTPVTGVHPRVSFAGWFEGDPPSRRH